MQTDPIGYADNMNMYGYVGNDPVNFVDPLGLEKTPTPEEQCEKAKTCHVFPPQRERNPPPPPPGSRLTGGAARGFVSSHGDQGFSSGSGQWAPRGNVVGIGNSSSFLFSSDVRIEGGAHPAGLGVNSFFYEASFQTFDVNGKAVDTISPIYFGIISSGYGLSTSREFSIFLAEGEKALWTFTILKFEKTCDVCGDPMLKVFEQR